MSKPAYSWIAPAVVALVAILGFVHSADTVRNNPPTVFSEPVFGWQTYCPLDSTLVHEVTTASYLSGETVSRVTVDGAHSHDMFSYSRDGELRLLDRQTGEEWASKDDLIFRPAASKGCPAFSYGGHAFELVGRNHVRACGPGGCASVPIKQGSYIFAYAAHAGGVVALTNYGDALLYRDGEWCRMTRRPRDVYECPTDFLEPIVTEPREVQFYASVLYRGRTLVGEWPTGRVYEFDGHALTPIENQPPFATSEPKGYEAQALANYCGDLYVGYWPTGEIWKLSHATGEWSLAVALFPPSDQFYPYSGRSRDDRNPRFYGRRVASLVLHGGSLYATTANLNDWPAEYETSVMSPEEAALYGATWRITRSGCSTSVR